MNTETRDLNPEALTPATSSPTPAPPAGPTRRPRSQVRETEEAVHLTLELPGVSEDGLELVREGQVLRVVGRRAAPADDRRVRFDEIAAGDFEERFRLSPKLDLGAIEARLANGILEVKLPVSRPETTRIPVRSGARG